ncbi:hypothetical protein [Enterobacter sp. 22452]|uniref:hypothetical protein n=1 Tax=Enterobacter TaxID=547 RepID=UPI003F873D41
MEQYLLQLIDVMKVTGTATSRHIAQKAQMSNADTIMALLYMENIGLTEQCNGLWKLQENAKNNYIIEMKTIAKLKSYC